MPFSAHDVRSGLSVCDLETVQRIEHEIDFELVRRRGELLSKGCIQIALGTKVEFEKMRVIYERVKEAYVILGGWRHVFINEETCEIVFVITAE